MKEGRSHLVVLAAFAALTVAMTWPMAAHLPDGVHDNGDPLLNSWILAWDVHQLQAGNLSGFFDANIFFPNRRTLAYSEHLFPQALAAAPVILATHNPVLAHNLVMLLSFLTSAFAMYLYGRYLTGRVAAGVLAGVVYGFSPFMFDHLAHVQIMAAAGFPLVFLFLARFFASQRWRDLALAGLFIVLQMLANGYYAVYLAVVLPPVIAYHALAAGKLREPRFLAKLATLAIGVVVLVGPFVLQYVAFQRDTGFSRKLAMSATPASFLATPPINRLYHGVVPGDHEARLFPGLVGIALAGLGVGSVLRRRERRPRQRSRLAARSVRVSTLFTSGVVLLLLLAVAVLVAGRVNLSTSSFVRPLLLVAVLIGLRAALDPPFARRWLPPLLAPRRWAVVHMVILVFAVLASLGDTINGPYRFLYEHLPGFDGLRAVARIHILTLFSLAALAAFGARVLLEHRRRWVRVAAVSVVPVLALAELVSVPVPVVRVPVGRHLPAVDRWLADEGGREPIFELPIDRRKDGVWRTTQEIFRVYASILHWRPIANGYSGWPAPTYLQLRQRWVEGSPASAIEGARELGVRELVLHTDEVDADTDARVRSALEGMSPPARLLYDDEKAQVWALPPPSDPPPPPPALPGKDLPRGGWLLDANVGAEEVEAAVDGDLDTAWEAGRGGAGASLTVDLGAVRTVRAVELDMGERVHDLPRGIAVEVSDGIARWRVVATSAQEELPISSYLYPTRMPLVIPIPVTSARYVRLTCTVGSGRGRWSVPELRIW